MVGGVCETGDWSVSALGFGVVSRTGGWLVGPSMSATRVYICESTSTPARSCTDTHLEAVVLVLREQHVLPVLLQHGHELVEGTVDACSMTRYGNGNG